MLGLVEQLLRLHLAELRERPPARLVAPDLLARGRERVEAVDLGVLVGGLVAVDHDLVTGLPAGHALADLPHDPGRVGPPDVVVLVWVVAKHRHGLPECRPDVVEVHAGGHHAHDYLERAGLRYLHLLDLEGVGRLAFALLADDPRGHRRRELSGLCLNIRHLAQIDGHSGYTSFVVSDG
jgi:hypothetical protein